MKKKLRLSNCKAKKEEGRGKMEGEERRYECFWSRYHCQSEEAQGYNILEKNHLATFGRQNDVGKFVLLSIFN